MIAEERSFTPQTKPRGFSWTGFSVRAYWDLLRALVAAQIKIRYGYTAIGLGWALLNPTLQMMVYAFIFGAMFAPEQAHFRMYLLAGLLPWQAFAFTVNGCASSLVNQSDLLKKAPFPSELLPISFVLNAMITLVIVTVCFIGVLIVRDFPVFDAIGWVLVAMVVEAVFLSGMALLVSCMTVFYRDIEQLLSFVVWLWFFVTPILYPLARLNPLERNVVLYANPMSGVVTTMQRALVEGLGPTASLTASACLATLTFAVGWFVFRRLQYELPKVA